MNKEHKEVIILGYLTKRQMPLTGDIIAEFINLTSDYESESEIVEFLDIMTGENIVAGVNDSRLKAHMAKHIWQSTKGRG